MENVNDELKKLQESLQMLLKKYKSLQRENAQLTKTNEELKHALEDKEAQLTSSKEKLLSSGFISQFGNEQNELFEQRINKYLKEIDKCLSILNA